MQCPSCDSFDVEVKTTDDDVVFYCNSCGHES